MENTTAGIIAGTGALGVVGGAGVGGLGLLGNNPIVTLAGASVAGLSLIPLAGGAYKLVSGNSKSNSTMGNDNVRTQARTQGESERERLQPNTDMGNTSDDEIPEWQRLGLENENEYEAATAAAAAAERPRNRNATNASVNETEDTDNDLTDEEPENYTDDYTEKTPRTRIKTESSSDNESKTSSSDISDDEFEDAKETFEEPPVKTTWLGSQMLGNVWNWGAGKLGGKSQTPVQQEEPQPQETPKVIGDGKETPAPPKPATVASNSTGDIKPQGSTVDGGSSERATATTPQPAPKPRGASSSRRRDQVTDTRDEARPGSQPPEKNSASRTSGLPRQKTKDRARIVNSSDNPDDSDVDQSLANHITKDNADLTAAQHRKKQPDSRRRETRWDVASPNTAEAPVQATKNVRFGATTTFEDKVNSSNIGPSNNSTPTPSIQQKHPSPPPQSTTRDLPTQDRKSVNPIPNRTPINTTNLSAEEIAAAERVKAREVRRPAFGSTAPESRMTSLRTSTRDQRSVTPTPNRTPINTTNLSAEEIAAAERVKAREVRRPAFGSTAPESRMTSLRTSTRDRRSVTPTPTRTPINTTNLSAEEIAAAERVRAREIQPPFSAAPRPKRSYSPDPIFRK